MVKTSPEKLAAALKANIARRKAVTRAQAAVSPENPTETAEKGRGIEPSATPPAPKPA
jgi:hypothetical protein